MNMLIPPKNRSDKEAAEFVKEIDEMLEDGDRFNWAEDTLLGIQETVRKSGRVTENQRRAVANIADARGGR